MKKILLIDINTILQNAAGNIKDLSFHKNAITMISKISRDLGYELILSTSEKTDATDYIRQILASENVALGSADDTASDKATTSIVSGMSNINYDNTIVFDAASNTWSDILHTLKGQSRKVSHQRITKETQISIELNPDGEGKADISTGLYFFDHMLDQIARHGSLDLRIHAKGDLHIDEHHTVEDTAITLGETFAIALGDKRGIERYGFCLPMDDALAQVAIDFGGRNWIVWDAKFSREKIGDVPTEMFYHFFKSFSDSAKCNLNIHVTGDNEHHKIEAIFKAFAKAIKMAVRRDLDNMQLPSTKGLL